MDTVVEHPTRTSREPWQNCLNTSFTPPTANLQLDAATVRRATVSDCDRLLEHLATYKELSFTHRWESGAIRRELLEHSGTIVLAEKDGDIIGVGVAGLHGMRGVIHHIGVAPHHRSEGIGRSIMQEMLDGLKANGILRVHIFAPEANHECRGFLESLGFAVQTGERLLQRDLIGERAITPMRPTNGIVIRPAAIEDLEPLLATLAPVPELAFQAWERALLENQLSHASNLTFFVAQDAQGHYVGALIGGHNGIRGSINHIWVDEEVRTLGIARHMLDESLSHFERSGVKRLHIMLTAGNEVGYRYWSRVNFQEIPGETFLERDI